MDRLFGYRLPAMAGENTNLIYGFEDKEWVNIGSMSLAQNEVGVVTNTCCFMICFMKYLEDHPISKWLVSWVIYHQ